jgi:callose synthase
LIAGILDFVLNFPGRHRCKFLDVVRNIMKIIVSAAWAVILPFFYISTAAKVDLPLKEMEKWFHYVKGVPPLYLLAVAVYLIPNILSAALFLFPMFRRWIESSDWHIVRLLLWWSQVFNSIHFIYFLFFKF